MRSMPILFLTPLFLIATSSFSYAFKLDPYSNFDTGSRTFERDARSKLFKLYPIHETLTLKAIAAAQIENSYKTEGFLKGIIAGVRWNDDPLNMARHRPHDWYASYTHSCNGSEEIGPDWDLLYRTHCGDMQFLHAMASSKEENAGQTKERILMWLEFTFKVASGQIAKVAPFQEIGDHLEARSATLFNELLTDSGKRRNDWQPESMFTFNCDRAFSLAAMIFRRRLTELSCAPTKTSTEQLIQDIALGSLLHTLQDSFSGSHVLRINTAEVGISKLAGVGKIVQFGNYAMQADKELHNKADLSLIEDDHTEGFDLTETAARIIEIAVQERSDKQERWEEAKQLFENLFEVVDPNKPPGDIGYR